MFENLIFYENHDTPFTSLHYAKYYYSNSFYKKSNTFSLLLDQDSIFKNLTPKLTRSIEKEYSKSDSSASFYINKSTKSIAEKLNINWNSLSLEEKKELNIIVDAKIMVANYDFFPNTSQNRPNNCGAACMKMICAFYGDYMSLSLLNILTNTSEDGASFIDLMDAGLKLNFNCARHKIDYTELLDLNSFPIIVNWNDNHFVVVYKANKNNVWIADPALGLRQYSVSEFSNKWMFSSGKVENKGRAVTFVPNEKFYR